MSKTKTKKIKPKAKKTVVGNPLSVGHKRLLKLADLLDKDADKANGIKFDMDIFGEVLINEDGSAPEKAPLNCNSAGCALGLAAMSGAFAKEGLTYKVSNGWASWSNSLQSRAYPIEIKLKNVKKYVTAREMAIEFFDLSPAQVEGLFFPSNPKTGAKEERRVATRIRQVIAGNLDFELNDVGEVVDIRQK